MLSSAIYGRSPGLSSYSLTPTHSRPPVTMQLDSRRSSFMSTLTAPFSMLKRTSNSTASAIRSFATPRYMPSGSIVSNSQTDVTIKQRLLQQILDYFRNCFNLLLGTDYALDGRVNLNKYIETIAYNLYNDNYNISYLQP